jgi:predicted acetyltransferase
MEWTDGDLRVRLTALVDPSPERGWVAQCEFTHYFHNARSGNVRFRAADEETLKFIGNIGYDVDFRFRGRRLAYRSTRLLLPFFASLGYDRVHLTVNPDNIASIRTCELLGAECVADVVVPDGQYVPFDRVRRRYMLRLPQ